MIFSSDSRAQVNSALIQIVCYICHSDSALFSNVKMSFVTWQSCVVAVYGNCWKPEVAHLVCCFCLPLYLTQSAMGQSESYYFLAENCGCCWQWKRSRRKCCTLDHLSVSVISHCSAIYRLIRKVLLPTLRFVRYKQC